MTMPLDWQNSRKWKHKQNVPVPEGKVGAPRASRIAKSDADKGRTGAGSHAEWRPRRRLSTGTGDTNLCLTVSTWPGRQEILCGIGQGWCRKGLQRPDNLTPSFYRLEKRGQGSVSELNLMTLKREETGKNKGPGKQSKAVGGKF